MSSVLTNEYYVESFWKHCPPDILMLIFKRLDVESLISCMRVTKSWSDTVHYYCQHYNLWGKMLEVRINTNTKTFEEKSDLNELDLFLSASHWLNIGDPTIILHNKYKVDKIRNISVFKGMLIVTSYVAFIFFDIKRMKKIKKCENNCLNYIESSSLIAELTLPNIEVVGYNILTLTNKSHCDFCTCIEVKKIILFDISVFKVHLNACYVIDINNVLWVYIANECKWDCKALARYYGNKESMTTIHVHDNDVYILLKTGDILKVDMKCKKLEKLLHLDVPLYYFDRPAFMFHKYSVILEVPKDKTNNMYPQKERKQTVVTCPGLTCSLEHGPLLITGYDNGKIDIFLIDDLVTTDTTPSSFIPIIHFYLQSYVNLQSFKIISIDIYEDTEGHHLFIATENNVFELLIT